MRKSILFLLLSWMFFGVAAQGYDTDITVARDGSGDFMTIQEAIDATKAFPDVPITIRVKNGIYNEKIQVYEWNSKLTIKGESKEMTIITWDDYFDKIDNGRNSTFKTYTMKVEGNDFRAENLTIINDAGPVGQAVALHVNADRVAFINCIIKGHQDTMYLTGEGFRSYFKDCFVSGTVDFIFGQGTAYFENCNLQSVADGYVTAASTSEASEFGFVFSHCELSTIEGVEKVYLGRPWRKYAKTVFLDCELDDHIAPEGWKEWSNKDDLTTVYYAEYNAAGDGARKEERVSWSHQLDEAASAQFSKANVLKGWDPGE